MFVYSVKASLLKVVALILASVSLICTLVFLIPDNYCETVFADDGGVVYTAAKTKDGRIEFLRSFGWEVDPGTEEATDVIIPSEFDSVFIGYNELQKKQGLDLSRYKRKSVTRYTYVINNYPNYDGRVYANLLIYRGRVIGGDICTESRDGFIHGFSARTVL